jgi:hypothetical protein
LESGNTRTCSPGRTRPVVEVPHLGPLGPGIPLPELVAKREDALLGPRALLVSPRASEGGVEAVLGDGVQQVLAQLRHPAVPELDHLGEVVSGVYVHDRKREPSGTKRLLGHAQEDGGVLAAREQQHRALELRRHFAHDVDGLGLQRVQVCQRTADDDAHWLKQACGEGSEGM